MFSLHDFRANLHATNFNLNLNDQTIAQWYLRDENSIEPEYYILQKISTMKSKVSVKNNDFWGGAQGMIQTAIRKTISENEAEFVDIKDNWTISVTEREVIAGILNKENLTDIDALVLMRTIEGLEDAVQQKDAKAGIYYTMPDEDRSLLLSLRQRVQEIIPTGLFRHYTVPWSSGGVDFTKNPEYVRSIVSDFVAGVKKQVSLAMSKRKKLNPVEQEIATQHLFAFNRAESFFGRDDVRENLSVLVR